MMKHAKESEDNEGLFEPSSKYLSIQKGSRKSLVNQSQKQTPLEMRCALTIKISDGLKRVFYLPEYGTALQLLKYLEKAAQESTPNRVKDLTQRYEFSAEDQAAVLGEGSFGKVIQAKDKLTKQVVAIKQISKMWKRQDQIMRMHLEIEFLWLLSEEHHQSMAKLLDVYEDHQTLSLVMELIEGASL